MNRCPKCKVRTTRADYEGASVRLCGECGGYWVTPVALKAIANRREIAFSEPVKERFLQLAEKSNSTEQLACLSCGKFMVKENFKDWDDIVIDRCTKCGGIWLDAGELEKIFRAGYTTKPRGSGYGLFLARRIVSDSGGVLDGRPGDAGGAVFEVRLPIAGEPSEGGNPT